MPPNILCCPFSSLLPGKLRLRAARSSRRNAPKGTRESIIADGGSEKVFTQSQLRGDGDVDDDGMLDDTRERASTCACAHKHSGLQLKALTGIIVQRKIGGRA